MSWVVKICIFYFLNLETISSPLRFDASTKGKKKFEVFFLMFLWVNYSSGKFHGWTSWLFKPSQRNVECQRTHLNPGTVLTMLPSLVSHVINGIGLPCAIHVILDPVLLLNMTCDGGSWTNDGTCKMLPCRLWSPFTITDTKQIWHSSEMKKKSNQFQDVIGMMKTF